MPELKQPIFKDIPLSFTAHPKTGNVKAITNREAVKQSVKSIILTNHFERPYNAYFGGDIISQLFENMDTITQYNIATNMRQALANEEPRAIIEDIVTDFDEDANAINATVIFRVANDSQPITVSVFLDRVR